MATPRERRDGGDHEQRPGWTDAVRPPVTYEVVLTAPARRALARLPPAPARAILELLAGAVSENPHRLGKPLHFELAGLYSARRGDYRIVYAIDDAARVVTVRAIGHRRSIYR